MHFFQDPSQSLYSRKWSPPKAPARVAWGPMRTKMSWSRSLRLVMAVSSSRHLQHPYRYMHSEALFRTIWLLPWTQTCLVVKGQERSMSYFSIARRRNLFCFQASGRIEHVFLTSTMNCCHDRQGEVASSNLKTSVSIVQPGAKRDGIDKMSDKKFCASRGAPLCPNSQS